MTLLKGRLVHFCLCEGLGRWLFYFAAAVAKNNPPFNGHCSYACQRKKKKKRIWMGQSWRVKLKLQIAVSMLAHYWLLLLCGTWYCSCSFCFLLFFILSCPWTLLFSLSLFPFTFFLPRVNESTVAACVAGNIELYKWQLDSCQSVSLQVKLAEAGGKRSERRREGRRFFHHTASASASAWARETSKGRAWATSVSKIGFPATAFSLFLDKLLILGPELISGAQQLH